MKDPTYRRLGDHSETIQIDYDPALISYEEILQLFWDNHDPAGRPWSRQYMSIIFYHSDEQQKAAEASRMSIERKSGAKIYTELVAFSDFYLAEDYHQKYYLQGDKVLSGEIKAYYPVFSDFINSTAAARLNGIVGGYGDPAILAEEIENYGLSPSGLEKIRRAINRSGNISSFF